jgi:glycerol transport system ATP-binding protein
MANADSSSGLTLRDIHKLVQGDTHLAQIDMRCPPGSFTVLLGRVRAGKTSLLRIMAGLDRPTRGQLLWDGRDVTLTDVRQRDVAMVYQQFVNYPASTVYENIASPLRVRRGKDRLEPNVLDRRVREIAERLRIEPLLSRLPAELSGGQQQRTAIARALAKSARLTLLDEPLGNLDYKLREELRTELRSFFAEGETSVVYATAEPNEALFLAGTGAAPGTIAVMDEGRLLQLGAAEDVYRAPQSERVARIFSDPELNVFDVTVSADAVRADRDPGLTFAKQGALAALPQGPARLGVRAHDLLLAPRSAADVRLRAEVTLEEISGSETLLRARSGAADRPLAWTAQWQGTHRHGLGVQLELFIDPRAVLAFDAQGAAVQGGH